MVLRFKKTNLFSELLHFILRKSTGNTRIEHLANVPTI